MKLFLIGLFFFCLGSTYAQSNKELVLGFTYGPSAITTFDGGEQPFQIQNPLYFGTTYFSGKWGINPYYNFGTNGIGVFLMHQTTAPVGTYLVFEQSFHTDFGVVGLGLTSPLYSPYVQGFIEFGHSYGEGSSPALVIGMYLSFSRQLKSW